jgi:hypothetical protein
VNGQLERSSARKGLTVMCSKVIIDMVQSKTNVSSSQKKLSNAYISASRITLGIAVELLTKQEIPSKLVSRDGVLSLFNNDIDAIISTRNKESTNPAVEALCNFINKNRNAISEEDLGGISELFSGHQAIWEEGHIQLVHNPERRGAGKIYTPFDVTNFMCLSVAKNIVSKAETIEQLFDMKVLDPAVGSGAFCSQFIRKLWILSRRKWKLGDESKFKIRVCQEMIHACDIDNEALQLAKVVMWITSGCPESGISLNFSLCDSLGVGSCSSLDDWKKHTGLDCKSGYAAVFGNPPYVRVKPEQLSNFITKSSRNLYAAFTELSINLLEEGGQFCFIVPLSLVGAKETQSLRDFLLEEDAEIRLQIFDSVPDFLFDQGKIESNTNTNINQRTVIVTLNRCKRKSLYTSPLLRWRRREERDILFKSLSQIKINETDIHNGAIPMLENKDDLNLYRALKKQKHTLSDVTSEAGRILYIPKAIRYFISAVPIDLERPNTIQLKIEEEHYEIVHVILNSNLFYWWWRVNGNGFQVEKKDILNFPLLPVDPELAAKYSKQLDDSLDECRVFKHNAGKQIPNINYNHRQDILQVIDSVLLASINLSPHDRVFGCKTNSLNRKMDGLKGYISEPSRNNVSNA